MVHLTALTDTFTLANGIKVPIVGFGTAGLRDATAACVAQAARVGYRHFDTAAAYGNEAAVGRGIRAAGVNREAVFITTKLANTVRGEAATQAAIDASLTALETDYIDLYLIHWPNPVAFREHWQAANAASWQAMEGALKAGKVRALGVANFMPQHLTALMASATVAPQVNQLFLNPSALQPAATAAGTALNLVHEAYSPLSRGALLTVKPLRKMAARYQRTPAQIALRWALQHNFLPLPRASDPAHIASNAALFDFELSYHDMQVLDQLQGRAGQAPDPDATDF